MIVKQKMMLDLCAGSDKTEGFTTVDLFGEPDIRHDLNKFPYPFESDSILHIRLNHGLEHLNEPVKVLEECRRILKLGCEIEIRVPHFSHIYAYNHPEHKRFFSLYSCTYFKGFKIAEARLYYNSTRHECERVRDIFPNILSECFPRFTERYLIYLLGGYQEIYWRLIKK